MSEDKTKLAGRFLQQAVFRSRGLQAVSGPGMAADGSGPCGLGEKAGVVLDLGPEGRALYAELWPADLDEPRIEAVRDVMRDWVGEQDALDRKRNHFLKAFRRANGGDRNAYTEAQLREYETGLADVNGAADARQRDAAARLLEIG